VDLSISEQPSPAASAVVAFPVDNLDAGNAKEFRAAIDAVVAGHAAIALDMSRLVFVDSSGLGALLSCHRAMNGKKGKLLLFGLNRPVRALFELSRMDRVFSICNSRDEALASLQAA
jgi:anti-sigma B factor antagonist